MSAEQPSRSLLERKERDELKQIAQSLGLEPASRTTKATLIGQILKATGADDSAAGAPAAKTNGDRPRRTRATKTAEPTDSPDGNSASDSEAATPATRSFEPKTSSNGSGSNGHSASDGTEGDTAETSDRSDSDEDSDGGANNDNSRRNQGRDRSANNSGASNSGDRNRQGGGQGNQGNSQSNQGGGQGNQGGGQQRWSEAEAGNRRGNRRRRGRDRNDRNDRNERSDRNERDLQGHGQEVNFTGDPIPVQGLLDLRDEGYGFVRTKGYLPGREDVYVSMSQVRRFALRKGDMISGTSRPATSTEKYTALIQVDQVNGMDPDEARDRVRFEDLTPLFPDSRLKMEMPGDPSNVTARIVDLIAPIGKGQRGLIVSPPKAGKTMLLKAVAHSIEANHPEVHLIVLLVDERPEEVTDMRRSVRGDVVSSTFDRPADEHTQVAELTIERAKRLVELGKDVVIVLDGITRLARAYNLAAPATGRIMSGGIDTGALYPPKKFFGAARNVEEGGSLTILATALIETGSKMDEVIFEEFKGTGNMELRLSRYLAEKRLYPAIDVNASSTRHEELLYDRGQLAAAWKLRRVLNALGAEGSEAKGLELLRDRIKGTNSNDEFLADLAKTPDPTA